MKSSDKKAMRGKAKAGKNSELTVSVREALVDVCWLAQPHWTALV